MANVGQGGSWDWIDRFGRRFDKADAQVAVGILNTLGNLLEGSDQLDEAEKL